MLVGKVKMIQVCYRRWKLFCDWKVGRCYHYFTNRRHYLAACSIAKWKKGKQGNQRLFKMKVFIEEHLWWAQWHFGTEQGGPVKKMPKIDTRDALGDEMTSILNILWTYSEHTLSTLWTHSEHILNTFWTYSEHTLKTLEHTLNTLWTHSKHTLTTLWAHYEHTLKTLWTHSEHTLNTL